MLDTVYYYCLLIGFFFFKTYIVDILPNKLCLKNIRHGRGYDYLVLGQAYGHKSFRGKPKTMYIHILHYHYGIKLLFWKIRNAL